jgi:GAF domain-containing protein
MSLLQQLIGYLSQPPDSIVYHVVTLLALQVTLGLAWWQVRRRPDDDFARRLAWASGIILLSRLVILLAYFATSELIEAVTLLPPLERAVDALAVALLVWALAPKPGSLPYLSIALLLIITIVIGILYVVFAIEWRSMMQGEALAEGYAASQQAHIWSILVMALLAVGATLVLIARESQWSLRLAILLVLFISQALSLFLGGSIGQPNVEVAFWNRLGNIVAFPMLAILAYRHNLYYLLPASHLGPAVANSLIGSITLSSRVTSSLELEQTLKDALTLITSLLPVRFVAVAQVIDGRPQHFQMTTNTADYAGQLPEGKPQIRTQVLRRENLPGLASALHNKVRVELVSDGTGARRLHDLNRELEMGAPEALLIEPLILESTEVGLLLVAGVTSSASWSEEEKALTEALASFLAQSLYNARRYQSALSGQAIDFERENSSVQSELHRVMQQRDQALAQSNELNNQLSDARERLDGDHRKLRETTQALAMAVERQTRVRFLESEVESLREALSEAELALAYAAAGEVGLSTEWVMRTVTRYSGELEEAQARIMALEEQQLTSDGPEMLEQAARLTGQLRTPLTALGGYTDLLLEQETGKISSQQESLLVRMRVNVDNMIRTVEELSTAARMARYDQVGDFQLEVQEAIEEAILAVSPKLQANGLKVQIAEVAGLPALQGPSDRIQELFAEALNAACLVSNTGGILGVSVQRIPSISTSPSGEPQREYVRVSVSDNSHDRSHHYYAAVVSAKRSEHEPAEIHDLATVLDKVSQLVTSLGGRSWVDLSAETGGVLFLLLPLTSHGSATDETDQ